MWFTQKMRACKDPPQTMPATRRPAGCHKRELAHSSFAVVHQLNNTIAETRKHQAKQSSITTYPILCPDLSFPKCDPGAAAVSTPATPGPLTVSVER